MPDTFHLFSILSLELRLAIWVITLKEPRIVAIRKQEWYHSDTFRSFHSYDPPPAITQVCSESRLEALKVYTRAFTYGFEPRYTYFNFELDRLIIPDFDFYYIPSYALERSTLQRLVVTTEDSEMFFNVFFTAEKGVLGLKALREFTCVGPDWDYPTQGEESRLKARFEGSLGHEEGWECPEITFVLPGVDGAFGARVREEGEN